MTNELPVVQAVRSTPSVTRGNPSLEEKYGKIDHFSMSDGFPRVTDNTRTSHAHARAAIGGMGTEEISEWLQGGSCTHDLHA